MEMPLKGSIRDFSLAKILVYLHGNQATGTLSLITPSIIRKIYLHTGDVIFASSTYEDDRLGETLLKAGKITVEQYNKSVEVLKTSGKKQGAILVELGYLTPKDLFQGVKYQVNEIIHSTFLTEDAAYEFEEGQLPEKELITLRMNTGNLVYCGVNRIINQARIRNEMPDVDSALKLSDDPVTLFQDMELSVQDRQILSLVNGKRTIREIIDNSLIGSFEALKALYVLWSIGMIEGVSKSGKGGDITSGAAKTEETVSQNEVRRPLSEEEETLRRKVDTVYEQLGSVSMDELLEVSEKTDSETVRKNYHRLVKEFHPDRYFSSTDLSVKMKLTAIFDAITKAYNALKVDKDREEYFESLIATGKDENADNAVRAAEQLKEGIADYKLGNFWGAIDKFKWVTLLTPDNAQCWSYLSLAYSRVPGRMKDAEEAILAALKLEPFNVDFHANLGLIYMKAGLKKRAHSTFEKALKIDSRNEKAKKGLEQTKE